jgi:hypothetical protein
MKTKEDEESEFDFGQVFVAEDESLLEDVEEIVGLQETNKTDQFKEFDKGETIEDCEIGMSNVILDRRSGVDDEESNQLRSMRSEYERGEEQNLRHTSYGMVEMIS